jgi:hypothetical protein
LSAPPPQHPHHIAEPSSPLHPSACMLSQMYLRTVHHKSDILVVCS